MPMRFSLAVALVASCLVMQACRADGQQADACSLEPADRPVTVLTRSDLAKVPVTEANVVLQVTSASRDPVRLTVRFGDMLAVHIEVPGTPSRCMAEPVYQYAYRLPVGEVSVTADSDQARQKRTSVEVSDQKHWIVVTAQKGFPLGLDVSTTRPRWAA